MKILRYTPECAGEWNGFVARARNATFLHHRNYLDYHSDRFADCSLMAYSDKGSLIALLPANRDGQVLYSHAGLTYAGWLTPERHFTPVTMLQIWQKAEEWMRSNGIARLIYKAVPWIYSEYPADDDLYAIFRAKGSICTCQVSAAIPLSRPLLFNQDARQRVKNASRYGISVRESDELGIFWNILESRLMERYSVHPVHTVDEMVLLKSRFPQSIRLFMADVNGISAGGVLVYFTRRVAHAQYIATTEMGRQAKVLPVVIDYIIKNECRGLDYFDFGTSCENGGLFLNEGLAEQKCGLGGRSVCYTAYCINL